MNSFKKNLFKTRKDQLHFWPRLVQTTTWFYLFGRNSISIYEYLLWLFFNFLGIIFQPKFRSRTLCCIFGFSQNFMFSDTTRMSGQWALNVLHCLRQTFSLTGCPVSIPAVPVPLLHPADQVHIGINLHIHIHIPFSHEVFEKMWGREGGW